MNKIAALRKSLQACSPAAIAVSGGVDSMTLACIGAQTLGSQVVMFHAVSPAVPASATARVRRYAVARGWRLEVIDAGEFSDSAYLANPVNRCFYCKRNLYGTIAGRTQDQILSGTNTDDLDDYRPGLEAAGRYAVRHPFVEAAMNKAEVRALARTLELSDLAELPAAPCLSSRVETGIAIDGRDLALIDRVEQLVRTRIDSDAIRCRIRRDGIVIELDAARLDGIGTAEAHALTEQVRALAGERYGARAISLAPYRRGSAFLRETP